MTTENPSLIKLEGVTKVFLTDEVETHALSGIHLDIRKGEYVSIAGPSGCGKSTLLSILGLLDSPTDGTYILNGRPVAGPHAPRARPHPQSRDRFHFPVLQPHRRPHRLRERRAAAHLPRHARRRAQGRASTEALEKVGMGHRAKHLPVPALRRSAAARRRRPRPRRHARRPPRRRAHRQPRLEERRRGDGAPRPSSTGAAPPS